MNLTFFRDDVYMYQYLPFIYHSFIWCRHVVRYSQGNLEQIDKLLLKAKKLPEIMRVAAIKIETAMKTIWC